MDGLTDRRGATLNTAPYREGHIINEHIYAVHKTLSLGVFSTDYVGA